MKRVLAAIVLLSALGALVKLVGKGDGSLDQGGARVSAGAAPSADRSGLDESALRARYPEHEALVNRVLDRYRLTALTIEKAEGLRGLRLLDKLDLEAIYLFEKHPDEFRQLADTLNEDAAAELLVHWSSYFGLKRADDVDRAILIQAIARLSPSQRRLAGKHPSALPLILADPVGVCDLIRRLGPRDDDPEPPPSGPSTVGPRPSSWPGGVLGAILSERLPRASEKAPRPRQTGEDLGACRVYRVGILASF